MTNNMGSIFVSRRGVLSWFSALAGPIAVADATAAAPAIPDSTSAGDGVSDRQIVAQLIALELETSALMGAGLSRFAQDEATSGDRLLTSQPTLATIWHHDRAHLALLKSSARALGANESTTATAETQPQPGNFAAFLWTTAELKGVSVAAYVEAVSAVRNARLRAELARILAVEARHAAYLNARIGEPSFNSALERALVMNNPLDPFPR